MDLEIMQGDVLERLADLKARGVKVRTCVTSPPYWGLRDYGTGQWRGGDAECDHNPQRPDGGDRADRTLPLGRGGMYRDVCGKCGAVRVDNQIGLERTPDEYVAKLVQVFRAVRDVLTDDGTIWVNLGDSYANNPSTTSIPRIEQGNGTGVFRIGDEKHTQARRQKANRLTPMKECGIKHKDLVGIPWRVAFALQADGWYLRSDIIWHKPNPMPESVKDRPTKAHEYIFLLSKSPKYFYDADAVREPLSEATIADKRNGTGRHTHKNTKYNEDEHPDLPSWYRGKTFVNPETGRNRRSVWTVTTKPYRGAHFATFPPDLIEPCILAGTSAKGQCPQCGAAWERVTGKREIDTSALVQNPKQAALGRKVSARINTPEYGHAFVSTRIDTGEWQPTCTCGADPVPDLVLDPFGGSGTTAEVAIKHGRRAILIELNPNYVELIKARVGKVQRVMA